MSSGLPPIAVRDIQIQQRENDLAIATFGRGFYILDDYTPLREFNKEMLDQDAVIFPVKDAKMYIQTGGKYGQGDNFYTSKNPPYGATFTYYIKEVPKTLKEIRQEKEKELFKEKKPIPQPGIEQLRAEKQERAPYLIFSIKDEKGREIRKFGAKAGKGIQRATWDLTYGPFQPVDPDTKEFKPVPESSGRRSGGFGMPALPGKYTVSLSMVSREGMTELAGEVPFEAKSLNLATLPAESREEVVAFQSKVADLTSSMVGAENFTEDLKKKLVLIKQTLHNTPGSAQELMTRVIEAEKRLEDVLFTLNGREARASWEEIPPSPMPQFRRLQAIIWASISTSSATTQTQLDNYDILSEEFPPVLEELKSINQEIVNLNNELDAIDAPWTPGRIPGWQ
jgi:hypothetical protein